MFRPRFSTGDDTPDEPGFGPGPRRGPRGFGQRGGFGPPGFGPRGGFAPGPGPGFRPGPGFGPGGPGGHGRRGRGNVRAAILALLREEPRHGYSIMTELAARSGGVWRPSPGSVYPVLQQLQDEGLVASTDADGRKVFDLTEAGREHVEEHAEELHEPWHAGDRGPRAAVQSLMHETGALHAAVEQIARVADDEQAAKAQAVLESARRSLYRILAGDETS
jgi:DNA-binding PadR family transcriptional regulator